MKGLHAPAIGVFIAAIMISTANAAPAGDTNQPKPKPQQGIVNAKKAMQSKLERGKQVRTSKEKGNAQRQQVQRGK